MINFQHISADTSLINDVEKLYLLSFPPEERRCFDKVKNLLSDENVSFHIITVSDVEGFIGFISYWDISDFVYVEHFAVEPMRRGGGIGATIMREMKRIAANKPIILEVEPPTEEMACRRIGFYQRLDFVLREDVEYMQPPYEDGFESIKLLLMHTGSLSKELLELCAKKIKAEVYGVKND